MLLVLGAIGLTCRQNEVASLLFPWAGENPSANELVWSLYFLVMVTLLLLRTVYIIFVTVQQTYSTLSCPLPAFNCAPLRETS